MLKSITKLLLAVALMLTSIESAWANDIKTVSGTYTYYGTEHDGPRECRMRALEGAKIEALKKEFGVLVNQDIYQQESADDTYVDIISKTEVAGEWISDIGEPEFKIDHDQDGNMIVTCTVKGKAKAITNETVEFEALVLCNGNTKANSGTIFISGDPMYLYVKAPVNGYLTVYLVDDEQNVFNLLPYIGDDETNVKIKANKEYIFFDSNQRYNANIAPDVMMLNTDKPAERDKIYVIFSPNIYNKAPDKYVNDLIPRMLDYEGFNRWLNRTRGRDPKMAVKEFSIEIKPY